MSRRGVDHGGTGKAAATWQYAGRHGRGSLIILGSVAACGLAWVMPNYAAVKLAGAVAIAIAAVGLNLLTGYSGQVSVGQAAFVGIGAYASGILVAQYHWNVYPTIVVGCVGSYLIGYGLAWVSSRLYGLYLAMVSLALLLAFGPVVTKFASVTGGADGLSIPPSGAPGAFGLAPYQWVYIMGIIGLALVLEISRRLTSGQVGWAIAALRDQRRGELLAVTVGVPVRRYKRHLFGLSAAMGGLAGVLYVMVFPFLAPSSFGVLLTLEIIVAVYVGGAGTITGPLVGALFVTYTPSVLGGAQEWVGVIYAAVLIVVVLVTREGIVTYLGSLAENVRMRKEKAHAEVSAVSEADGLAGKEVRLKV